MFDNVNTTDKLFLTVTFPAQIIRSLLDFHFSYTFPVIRQVENWYDLLLVYANLASSKEIRFKSGGKFLAKKSNISEIITTIEYLDLPSAVREKFFARMEGKAVSFKMGSKRLKVGVESARSIISEAYLNTHGGIDVRGRVVLDIGAYIGDSPIYYALIGNARHIYALEPNVHLYNLGLENIKRNGLSQKISMLNLAASGEDGSVRIPKSETNFGEKKIGKGAASERGNYDVIRAISLDSLVAKFKIKDGALKIDCEGFEYEIIKGASSAAIKSFQTIHIEYHFGYLDLTKRLISEGYTVSCTRPKYIFKGFGSRAIIAGDIIANRTNI